MNLQCSPNYASLPPASQARATPNLPTIIRFGESEVRRDTREVFLCGQPQAIRRRVFDLLEYLIAQYPRTVNHQELLSTLWHRREGSSNLLARAVMEARRAIGDDPCSPRCIVSVHGVGYRFAAEFSGIQLQEASPLMPDLSGKAAASVVGAGQLASGLDSQPERFDVPSVLERSDAEPLSMRTFQAVNAEGLQRALEQTCTHLNTLQQEVDRLSRRLEQLSGTLGDCAITGLAAPAQLGAMMRSTWALAHQRGLPMCMVVLRARCSPTEPACTAPSVDKIEWVRVCALLGKTDDVILPAMDLGEGSIAFRIADAGLDHARHIAQGLLLQLRSRWAHGEVPIQWHCSVIDMTRHGLSEDIRTILLSAFCGPESIDSVP